LFKKILRFIYFPVSSYIIDNFIPKFNRAILVAVNSRQDEVDEIMCRFNYFTQQMPIDVVNLDNLTKIKFLKLAMSFKPILLLGVEYKLYHMIAINIFNIDYNKCHVDSWSWHRFLYYIDEKKHKEVITSSKKKFIAVVDELSKLKLDRSYIFGTGPSLISALNYDWSNGFRIVCNTTVKSERLWNHIKPHFIVAGDAIHHFSQTQYAKSFRSDLKRRLASSEVYFIYPLIFDNFIRREFSEFDKYLIAVPSGYHDKIHVNLCNEFKKPSFENVLTMLQLPVACTLSKNIFFYGYDGRGKNDQMFWSSSEEYNYIEHMPELHQSHPSFFNYYVPKSDPFKYVKKVHGDILEKLLAKAESLGWKFTLLHISNTETLQKRFKPNILVKKNSDV